MYISKDWNVTLRTLKLAEKYNYHGVTITVDTQTLGIRRKQEQHKVNEGDYKFKVLDEISQG